MTLLPPIETKELDADRSKYPTPPSPIRIAGHKLMDFMDGAFRRFLFFGVVAIAAMSVCIQSVDDDQWEIVAKLVASILPVNAFGCLLMFLIGKHVADQFLLEASDTICVRDSVRSTWTNLSVVSTLIFSLSVTVLLATKPTGTDDSPASEFQTSLFAMFAMTSACWSAIATFYPVFCLVFTDNLSDSNIRQFIKEMPTTLGYPVSSLAYSVLALGMCLLIWVDLTYGKAVCILSSAITFMALMLLLCALYDIEGFTNEQDAISVQSLQNITSETPSQPSQRLSRSATLASLPERTISGRKRPEERLQRGRWQNWTATQVQAFLNERCHLDPEDADKFREHGINGKCLKWLSDEHLQKMELKRVGSQIKVMQALKNLFVGDEEYSPDGHNTSYDEAALIGCKTPAELAEPCEGLRIEVRPAELAEAPTVGQSETAKVEAASLMQALATTAEAINSSSKALLDAVDSSSKSLLEAIEALQASATSTKSEKIEFTDLVPPKVPSGRGEVENMEVPSGLPRAKTDGLLTVVPTLTSHQ